METMNILENNRFYQVLGKFIMLGSLAVLGLAIVVFYPTGNKSNSNLNTTEEEQRILGVLSQYIGGADEVVVHPTSIKLSYSGDGEESSLFIVEKDQAIEIIDLAGNNFTISSPGVSVSDLAFSEVTGEEGKVRVQASFILSPSGKKNNLLNNTALKATVFDSDILPVSGSPIQIGLNAGDFSAINKTIYLSASGNVGITSPTPTERLHISAGGLRIQNATSNFPDCNASNRGTIWMVQPGGVAGDRFAVCLRQGGLPETYKWAEYQGL
jgi:hypothetical protein